MRKILLALAAVLSLLVVSACGASGGKDSSSDDTPDTTAAAETTTTEAEADTVPVDDWAKGFCSDFSDWTGTIEKVGDDISSDITPGDLEGARSAIEGLFGDVADETQSLVDSLQEGGTPDIDDGEQFVDDLSEKFQAFVDATNDSKEAAADIPIDDPTTFQSEFTKLFEDFQSNINDVGDSFGELDSRYPDPELQKALTDNCNL
ncbi:MAG: hypothetical protein KF703_12030 [Actinobacteria bacterium]|nr:hypothetical protein [Actinomycetota bacterium]